MDPLVQGELVILQREVGEDLVLGEQVVHHQRLAGQIPLGQLLLLPEPTQQEPDLRLKRIPPRVLVEAGQKRVVVGHLQEFPRPQPL